MGSSASGAERQNLTMRMSMRRFKRLPNAFLKKLDNHKAAVAFYAMWYNFARIQQTLRVTSAMEAGVPRKSRGSLQSTGEAGIIGGDR